MKMNFWKSVLAVLCVLALAAGFLPTAFAYEEGEFIYVNGEAKVFNTGGELSAILRLPVEVPGRIHILTSGVNISLAIYDEETFELFGVYYTENGLIDVPFDAYSGTFLLGFSGWGEVSVLVADEGTTAQLYANAQAAEEPAEEWVEEAVEEWAEEPEEEYIEEAVEELTEAPEEVPAEDLEEASVEEPVEETEEEPAEESAEKSTIEEWSEESVEVPEEFPEEDDPEEPVEKVVKETTEEPVEEAEDAVEHLAESPAEQPSEEVAEEPAEEPEQEAVEESPAVEAAEEPAEEAVEEPAEEPVYYDPAVPIQYEFTGNGTVSVLSILNGVGAPVNMVMEVTRETDGFFSAFGSSDGDWLLTPFAYFDSIEVSVRAGYYNAADGSIKEAVYTVILSYPDPAQPEEIAEEIPAKPAEEAAEETIEEPVEEAEDTVEESAESPAEQPIEEVAEAPAEELEQEAVEESAAVEAAEEPAEEAVEEPAEEPVYYDPAVPIQYEFTGNGTVSVLSILKEVGAPVNMVLEVTRDTDGWFFATGSSDGDWLLTPFAYFEGIEASVRAGYYDASNGSITDAVYTLNLSYPDPNAKEAAVEEAKGIEVTIAVERREGNEIRLFAENLDEEADKYTYQWQYSLDSEEWFAVEGATGRDYTFRLDQTNGRYYWRLIVSEKS